MSKRKENKPAFSYARYSGIAFQMGGIIFLGVFGGQQLDKLLGLSFPAFTLVLSLTSVSLAIYIVIRDLLK